MIIRPHFVAVFIPVLAFAQAPKTTTSPSKLLTIAETQLPDLKGDIYKPMAMKFFKLTKPLDETPTVQVLDVLFKPIDDKYYVRYELKISGRSSSSSDLSMWRTFIAEVKNDQSVQIVYDTDVFQPECGSLDFKLTPLLHTRIAGRDTLVIQKTEIVHQCAGERGSHSEKQIYLDVHNRYSPLMTLETLSEKGRIWEENWTYSRSHPISDDPKVLPKDATATEAFCTIVLSDPKRPKTCKLGFLRKGSTQVEFVAQPQNSRK